LLPPPPPPFPPLPLLPLLPPPHPHIKTHVNKIAASIAASVRIGRLHESDEPIPSVLFNRRQISESNVSRAAFACVRSCSVEKAMSNVKRQVESLLHNLPENCSLEDIQYHLYVLEKVRRGLDEARQGAVTQAAAEKHLVQRML
jgi:hypothetical protein